MGAVGSDDPLAEGLLVNSLALQNRRVPSPDRRLWTLGCLSRPEDLFVHGYLSSTLSKSGVRERNLQ